MGDNAFEKAFIGSTDKLTVWWLVVAAVAKSLASADERFQLRTIGSRTCTCSWWCAIGQLRDDGRTENIMQRRFWNTMANCYTTLVCWTSGRLLIAGRLWWHWELYCWRDQCPDMAKVDELSCCACLLQWRWSPSTYCNLTLFSAFSCHTPWLYLGVANSSWMPTRQVCVIGKFYDFAASGDGVEICCRDNKMLQ